MSVYRITVSKDGQEVRQWEIRCSSGADPDHVFVGEDGEEVPVSWSEVEANSFFEEELTGLLDGWDGRGQAVDRLWVPEELPEAGQAALNRFLRGDL